MNFMSIYANIYNWTSGISKIVIYLNIFINRFDGVGMFYYSKTKKSDWPLIKENYKVKCTKVDREF